jgi:plasmid maintenance system antidote protein VapI
MTFTFALSDLEEKQAKTVSDIGRSFQQRFNALGFTPGTFADRMEVEPNNAMRLLSGSRDFRICELISVADVLGMDVEIKLTAKAK